MLPTDRGDDPNLIDEEAAAWLVRLSSGDSGPGDLEALARWRGLSPAHEAAWEAVAGFWRGLEPSRDQAARELPALLREMSGEGSSVGQHSSDEPSLRRKPGPGTAKRRVRRVAIGGLAIAASWLLVVAILPLHRWQADYATGVGEQRTVDLPDGSVAELNTHTALALRFSDAARGIEILDGEAAFKVSTDGRRPFIVTSGGGSIRAVGTEFAVTRIDGATTVALLEGSVEVRDGHGGELRLSPGQLARYGESMAIANLPAQRLKALTAWRDGYLMFENAPLEEVIADINRYRSGYILLQDPSLARRRVSGLFRIAALDQAIDTIAEASSAKLSRFGDYLLILR